MFNPHHSLNYFQLKFDKTIVEASREIQHQRGVSRLSGLSEIVPTEVMLTHGDPRCPGGRGARVRARGPRQRRQPRYPVSSSGTRSRLSKWTIGKMKPHDDICVYCIHRREHLWIFHCCWLCLILPLPGQWSVIAADSDVMGYLSTVMWSM